MAKKDYPFPDDEFDLAGSGRVPQGVHRTPRARWRALLPFVVVLLLAPTLAYAGVSYLVGQGDTDGTGSGVSAAPTGEPEATPTPEATEATDEPAPVAQPTPTPTPEPTPEEPEIPRDVRVAVLNGTTTPGLAGSAAARLQEDGFTSTTLGNVNSSLPTRSTVYYNNASLEAPARQVAAVLGIPTLMELSSATSSIAVVLRSDYVN